MAKKKKKVLNPRVPRTHNGGTMTSSEWHGKIISSLRQLSRWYIPPRQAKLEARRLKPKSVVGRHIYEYKCASCGKYFKDSDIAIDHIKETDGLKSYADLPRFCERLFCDKEGYQILCNKDVTKGIKNCHYVKTQKYMKDRRDLKKGGANDE